MEATKDVGFSDYFASIRRRRRLGIAVAVPVAVAAFMLALMLPRSYVAPAEFRFQKAAIAANENTDADHAGTYVDEYVAKLSESVLATDKLTALRQTYGLYPNVAKTDAALKKFKSDIHVDMTKEQFLDPETGHAKDVNSGFSVSYDAPTADTAQSVSQWLVKEFITVSRQVRQQKSLEAAKFLQNEADRYKGQITDLEGKVALFKQQHQGELPDSVQNTIVDKDRYEQDLNNVEEQLRTLQQNRVFLTSQLQQVPASADNEALKNLQDEYAKKKQLYDENHPDMIALRHQIAALQRADTAGASGTSLQSELASQKLLLDQTRQRYSDDYPDVRRIKRDIAALEARIAAGEKTNSGPVVPTNPIAVQLQTQLNGNENEIRSLEVRRDQLSASLQQLQGRVSASPQVEKAYEAMTRDLALSHDKYDELSKRMMDAQFAAAASLNGTGDEFTLVSAPTRPAGPAKPSRVGIVLVGLIVAVILAAGSAMVAEMLDGSVRGSRDLAEILHLSPLAVVPEIHNSRYHRHRFRQAIVFVGSMAAGVPVLYFLVRLVAH